MRQLRKPDAMLSTNTSGIPLPSISEGFPRVPPALPRHALLQSAALPAPAGSDSRPRDRPEVLACVSDFCDAGWARAWCSARTRRTSSPTGSAASSAPPFSKVTVEGDYTIEEVDALTGPLIGLPKSASFRLLDIVGLDVWAHVSANLYELVPQDPWRERFRPADFHVADDRTRMARGKDRAGLLQARRQGEGDSRHRLEDVRVSPGQKPKFPSVEAAKVIEDLAERLRALVASNDRAGKFLWKLFSDYFLYSAEMVPEISDRIVEIDRAMRWGYAHKLGPFELWDALGVPETVDRMDKEGRTLPAERRAHAGRPARRRSTGPPIARAARHRVFRFQRGSYEPLEQRPGVIVLSDVKRARGVVKKNAGASLVDLGDGVLCLRVSQQDELDRRGHHQHALRRARGDRRRTSRLWWSPTRAKISASAQTW